ncbi:MAG TPA: cytochrome P450 [Streptosporangiaceae bacterium]|nr:cytochrome P450 [Streptosporangiaceae bacterium]
MSSQQRHDGTPGPTGRQAAAVLAGMLRDPLAGYLRLARDYGDAVRVPISRSGSIFMLSRPEHAEHVLAHNQDNYVKAFTYRPLRALIGNGLLTSEGEEWRRHRRLLQPLFARRDVTAFGPAMSDAAARMLKSWEPLPAGAQIDVAARMSALALDIVGRALFSADLSGDAEMMGRALSAGQRVAVLATFVPLPWGPRTTRAVKAIARRTGRTGEGIEGPVGRMVADRRRRLNAGNGQHSGGSSPPAGQDGRGPGRDLLDVLLTARQEDGSPLTDTEVCDELATFLLAGHETSAVTLSWALALLSAFPAARVRLEAEVDSVLAGRSPDAADAPRLPWTTAVIAETMRLYPPAWTIERDALGDDDVAGVAVPAGSTIAVPPYLIHRHPEFWPDPAGFDPARFLPPGQQQPGSAGETALAAERPRYAYVPFGAGRRACIGQSFAELETVLVLASIAQRYRLELTASGIPKPVAAITLRPGRLPMRLLPR